MADSTPKNASPVSAPAATMKVNSSIRARLFSEAAEPSERRISSTLGRSLRVSHQSRAAPPISIGKVTGVGRYMPSPKDVPIPVAHSAKAPSRKPRPRAYQSPCPSARMMVNAAKALAWGASRSMLPSASSLDRKIATPAPSMAPGTTPSMFPLEM